MSQGARNSDAKATVREPLLRPRLHWIPTALSWLVCAGLLLWSAWGLKFDFTTLPNGIVAVGDYLGQTLPKQSADWKYDSHVWHDLIDPLISTIQIGVFGSALGTLLAFPMACMAARTGLFPLAVSIALKSFLNVSRAIPTIMYALVAVSAVGLGAPAGALTMAFVSFISLSKLFAEALEAVSVGPVEAVRAAGGNSGQVFIFAMLPQVIPVFLSNALFQLEYNFRDSFIIGVVGAGGLGAVLLSDVRLYKMLDVGVIIAMIIVVVNILDYISFQIRRRVA